MAAGTSLAVAKASGATIVLSSRRIAPILNGDEIAC
jgi:hypothetical protein